MTDKTKRRERLKQLGSVAIDLETPSVPIIDIGPLTTPAKRACGSTVYRICDEKWAEYCDKRDAILKIHAECLAKGERTPKLVFIFSAQTKFIWRTWKPPGHTYPKNRIKWLDSAISYCDKVLEHPHGTSYETKTV